METAKVIRKIKERNSIRQIKPRAVDITKVLHMVIDSLEMWDTLLKLYQDRLEDNLGFSDSAYNQGYRDGLRDCLKDLEKCKAEWNSDVNQTIYKISLDAQTVLELPKNATNGDMIKAIFPDAKTFVINELVVVGINGITAFDTEWWNAPHERR